MVVGRVGTRDGGRPGVARIVAAGMPRGHQGAVIMMHDAGGNRAETVQALPQIITRLRARGYRFVTVTGGLGLPSAGVPAPPGPRPPRPAPVLPPHAAAHAPAALGVLLAGVPPAGAPRGPP